MIKEENTLLSDFAEIIRVKIEGKDFYYPGTKNDDLDTYIEILKREEKTWNLVGSTEIAYSTKSPNYQKQFELVYQFEEISRYMIVVYKFKTNAFIDNLSTMSQGGRSLPTKGTVTDLGSSPSKKRKNQEEEGEKEILGRTEFELGLLVGAAPDDLILELEYGEEIVGDIQLSFKKVDGLKKEFEIKLKAKAVKNTEWFSKTDPYIKIYRVGENYQEILDPQKIPEKGWEEVYSTESVDNCLDPNFKPFSITSMKLCRGNFNSFLKFEIFNFCQKQKVAKKDKFISRGFLKLGEAIDFHYNNYADNCFEIETFDRKKKFAGRILIEELKVAKFYSLIDFLKSKLDISTAFGIDFTASNGDPDDARSYHYTLSGANPYQKIMYLVGNVLKPYDSQSRIYGFGFGAKVKGYTSDVSHCFELNKKAKKPYVKSLKKLKKKYLEILPSLKLLGPTYFSTVIRKCLDIIKDDQRDVLIQVAQEAQKKEQELQNIEEEPVMEEKSEYYDSIVGDQISLASIDNEVLFNMSNNIKSINLESSIIDRTYESARNNLNKRATVNLQTHNPHFQTPNLKNAPRMSAYAGLERRVSYIPPTATLQYLPKMPKKSQEDSKKKSKNAGSLPPLKYKVIVLLTDGDVCDPENVLNELIRANSLPVSIIVVGIGEEKMDMNEKIFSKSFLQEKSAGGIVRDFLKFFYWKDFLKLKKGSRQFLRDCFSELPMQIVRFYKMRGIVPFIKNED